MKLVYQCIAIFFNFFTTLNHLHPLQVENCLDGLWWMKMTMVNSGLKGLMTHPSFCGSPSRTYRTYRTQYTKRPLAETT